MIYKKIAQMKKINLLFCAIFVYFIIKISQEKRYSLKTIGKFLSENMVQM